MIGVLISTGDYKDGKYEIVERERFLDDEMRTKEGLVEVIFDMIIRYKDHDGVLVKYSLLNKRLHREISGVTLRSLINLDAIKYEIKKNLEEIINYQG